MTMYVQYAAVSVMLKLPVTTQPASVHRQKLTSLTILRFSGLTVLSVSTSKKSVL